MLVKVTTMKNKMLLSTIVVFQIANSYNQNFEYLNFFNLKARIISIIIYLKL